MSDRNDIPPIELRSFGSGINAAVIGATGGIGGALAAALEASPSVAGVARLARSCDGSPGASPAVHLDLEDEASIEAAAASLEAGLGRLHLVIVATGVLHDGESVQPEKTWRHLSPAPMERAFRINATGPALVAKHFLPLLAEDRKAVFAAISARIGSIEDNRLGGWYAYRASKAALNMILRTLSIELGRRNPSAICVGLHPGTVDTPLSAPFQRNVPNRQLLSPDVSARHLLGVIDGLGSADTGKLFAWDGEAIPC
jgi:NAD(P)-dependent dehydrogenase (short-subunit alcohol dehydrogenase family)